MTEGLRELELRLTIGSDEELDELEKALLKARATELSEVRRQNLRFTAGYGDATSRDVMGEVGRLAEARYDVLSRLIEAIGRARGTRTP
jgi:hypothetical protein